jgi:ATP-dependent protease ClpP protease subunit
MLFGGGNTTYGEIVSAIAEAEANTSVSDITLAISSPGGEFEGLFDALEAIEATKKPIKALGINLVASAAYAIASKAGSIVATNKATRVGSIGVAASFEVNENEVTVTSTNAPKKRPDVTTEEGKAVVREELDAMEDIFTEAIAEGRGLSQDKVIADFGQGATVLANEALKRGMIDSIARPSLAVVPNTNSTTAQNKGGNQPEATKMDRNQLKADHPDVYQAAVQDGVDKERDRVGAHLMMGESSGDTKTAFASIRDGSEMTATIQATYLSAGMNRSDINARTSDDVGVTPGAGDDTDKDAGDAVASLVEAKLGVEA